MERIEKWLHLILKAERRGGLQQAGCGAVQGWWVGMPKECIGMRKRKEKKHISLSDIMHGI